MAGTATVPPGHQVVVVHPSPAPHFSPLKSGYHVADLGYSGDFAPVLARAESLVHQEGRHAIVWILQTSLLQQTEVLDSLLAFLAKLRQEGIHYVAVFPHADASYREQVTRLRGIGIGVHASAPDGACFVEVHRPDGSIVIGMPGPAFAL